MFIGYKQLFAIKWKTIWTDWQSRGRRFEPDLLHKGFQSFYLETLFICTQFARRSKI